MAEWVIVVKKIGKLRISVVKNESFVDLNYAKANVGESIQSVAMQLIYDMVGIDKEKVVMIDQCGVKAFHGEEIILPLRLPLSKDNVDEFLPLNKCVHPFFISLHLHDDIFEGRSDLIEYFKKYEPIGCRDEISCGFFRLHGIESYIMGCYTLIFPERKENEREADEVIFVDASEELLKCVPERFKHRKRQLSHAVPYQVYPVTPEEDERLENKAREYLSIYRKRAGLVVTSRLHVASPCIAMGIPVILGTDNADFRYAWIDRFVPVNQIDEYTAIDWNPFKIDVRFVKERLYDLFDGILNHEKMRVDVLQKLDQYYRNRKKTEFYKLFRNRLSKIEEQYGDNKFTYIIWGAGNHSLFAYQLISERFPNGKLLAVADRFKSGTRFGVPIIHGDEAAEFNPDFICITTRPGLEDGINGCKNVFGDEYESHYIVIASQQES